MVFRWFGRKPDKPIPHHRNGADAGRPDRIYHPGDIIAGEWLVLRTIEGGLGSKQGVILRFRGGSREVRAP